MLSLIICAPPMLISSGVLEVYVAASWIEHNWKVDYLVGIMRNFSCYVVFSDLKY